MSQQTNFTAVGSRGQIKWPSDRIVLVALLAVSLLPIWMFDYVPTQDGPSHLHMANVLLNFDNPDFSVLSKYYRLDWFLSTNLLIYLILQPLMMVLPPLMAEKVLLTTLVIGLPLAAGYAVRSPRGDGLIAALLGMQLTYGFIFHMGFYNFSFGMIFFLLGIGYWRCIVDQLQLRQFIFLALLVLFTYFSHIFAALNLIFFIGLAFLWHSRRYMWPGADYRGAWDHLASPGAPRKWRQLARPAALHLIAVLPALVLIVTFVLNNSAGEGEVGASVGLERLILLFFVGQLWSFTPKWEIALTSVWLAGVLIMIRHIRYHYQADRSTRLPGPFLFVLLAYFAVFMVIPNSASGSNFMLQRFLVYVLLAVLLWLSTRQFRPTFRKPMIAVLGALTLTTIGLRLVQYEDLNDQLDEYLAGIESIEPNRTILALSLEPEPFPSPFIHAAGYIATLRNGVDLKTIQPHKGHVPVRYRRELDPYRILADGDFAKIEAGPPTIDINSYSEKTDGQIDYVLLWGRSPTSNSDPRVDALMRQLDQGYELIVTSPQTGRMRLYRRAGLRKTDES